MRITLKELETIIANAINEAVKGYKDTNFKYHEGDKVAFMYKGEKINGVIDGYDYNIMNWEPFYNIDFEKDGRKMTMLGVSQDKIEFIEAASDEEFQNKFNRNRLYKSLE